MSVLTVPCPRHYMTQRACTDECLPLVAKQAVLMLELSQYWESNDWKLQFQKYKQYLRTHQRLAA